MDQATAKQPAKERLKVIVRKLPPGLSEEGFRSAVDKLIADKFTWLSYYQGKFSTKRVQFSRAYIDFISSDAIFEFKSAFDGHVFVGSKGNQYQCAVEYAPFQKVPDTKTKKDTKDGTIEKDADYQEFIRLLESDEALPSASAQLEEKEKAAGSYAGGGIGPTSVIVTPLMKFLQERHAANPGLKIGLSRGGGSRLNRRDQEKKEKAAIKQPRDAKEGAKKLLSKAADAQGEKGNKQDKLDKYPKPGRGQPASKAAAPVGATGPQPATSGRAVAAKVSKQAVGKASGTAGDTDPPQKVVLLSKPKQDVAADSNRSAKSGREPSGRGVKRGGAGIGAKPHSDDSSGAAAAAAAAALSKISLSTAAPTSKASASSVAASKAASACAPASTGELKLLKKTAQESNSAPAAKGESANASAPAAPAATPAAAAAPTRRVRTGFTAYVPGALRAGQPKAGTRDAKSQGEQG
eukprot:gene14686-20723_t